MQNNKWLINLLVWKTEIDKRFREENQFFCFKEPRTFSGMFLNAEQECIARQHIRLICSICKQIRVWINEAFKHCCSNGI